VCASAQGRGPAGGGTVTLLERVFRDEWGRVLASLIGFLGDSTSRGGRQEAFAIGRALGPRRRSGDPGRAHDHGRNRAIDRIRRERTLAAKTRQLDVPEASEDTVFDDIRFQTSGSSSSSRAAIGARARRAVALTLRTLGGLTTEEIARAFLVAPAA